MRSPQSSDSRPDLVTEIETLFDTLSANPPVPSVCKECHSVMIHVDTLFFCYDGLRSWNIPLPVCPHCCMQSLKKSPLRAA